jgi:hypothetical protein
VGCCERENKIYSFVKGDDLLDQISDYQLLKEDSSLASKLAGISFKHSLK